MRFNSAHLNVTIEVSSIKVVSNDLPILFNAFVKPGSALEMNVNYRSNVAVGLAEFHLAHNEVFFARFISGDQVPPRS